MMLYVGMASSDLAKLVDDPLTEVSPLPFERIEVQFPFV